jgi:hypothetical protein
MKAKNDPVQVHSLYRKRICTMTKHSLAAQLRYHAVQQGDFSVTEMDDDEMLKKYTRCSCSAYHATGETLDRLTDFCAKLRI